MRHTRGPVRRSIEAPATLATSCILRNNIASRGEFMKHAFGVAVLGLLLFTTGFSTTSRAQAADKAIASRMAEVNGVKFHYLTAGHGTPLILLHGYAETSLMWKPIIPALAERFTVIAPDLPGIGDSDIPADGL